MFEEGKSPYAFFKGRLPRGGKENFARGEKQGSQLTLSPGSARIVKRKL